MNLFEGSEDFGFQISYGWMDKYKPALSKSDSSWDYSYCLRLAIVSLNMNVGRLQLLVSDDSFFCCFFCCSNFNKKLNPRKLKIRKKAHLSYLTNSYF